MKTEIIKLLFGKYPDYTIYDDGYVPQDFVRPSFCVVTSTSEHKKLNINITQRTERYSIICLTELDEYGKSTTHESVVNAVCRLFDSGKVASANVKQVKGEIGFNEGYVDVTLEYYETIRAEQQLDKMTNIHIERN